MTDNNAERAFRRFDSKRRGDSHRDARKFAKIALLELVLDSFDQSSASCDRFFLTIAPTDVDWEDRTEAVEFRAAEFERVCWLNTSDSSNLKRSNIKKPKLN